MTFIASPVSRYIAIVTCPGMEADIPVGMTGRGKNLRDSGQANRLSIVLLLRDPIAKLRGSRRHDGPVIRATRKQQMSSPAEPATVRRKDVVARQRSIESTMKRSRVRARRVLQSRIGHCGLGAEPGA